MTKAKYRDVINDRKEHSINTIKKLSKSFNDIHELKTIGEDFCVYVTGSLGRHEASNQSDLDLFFINENKQYSKITKTLIDADIIRRSRITGFEDFSNDGQYLVVHNINDIISNIGSQNDDSDNYFTARMLLLLESEHIYNKNKYYEYKKNVIDAYWRDYHDHEENFRPVFIVNDILRYWRTLCLNYEHKRNFKIEDEMKKKKIHLKNLKLKFSRLLTCFSAIIPIVNHRPPVNPEFIFELLNKKPLDRVESVCKSDKDKKCMDDIKKEYRYFLELDDMERIELLTKIGDKDEDAFRNAAFDRARNFGKLMYKLLYDTAHKDLKRYLTM